MCVCVHLSTFLCLFLINLHCFDYSSRRSISGVPCSNLCTREWNETFYSLFRTTTNMLSFLLDIRNAFFPCSFGRLCVCLHSIAWIIQVFVLHGQLFFLFYHHHDAHAICLCKRASPTHFSLTELWRGKAVAAKGIGYWKIKKKNNSGELYEKN